MRRNINVDFDRDFNRMARRNQRFFAFTLLAIVTFWVLVAAAILYGVSHPEVIGSFFGRIAAGFRGAA